MSVSIFDFQINHIRFMWGLRKGVTIIYNNQDVIPVGYMNLFQQPAANDNEVKP